MATINEIPATDTLNPVAGGEASASKKSARKTKPAKNPKAIAPAASPSPKVRTYAERNTAPKAVAETKTALAIKKLRAPKGVTIEAMMEATGWQAHSVRGFFSAVVKKKLGFAITSDVGKDGVRRYRIGNAGAAK